MDSEKLTKHEELELEQRELDIKMSRLNVEKQESEKDLNRVLATKESLDLRRGLLSERHELARRTLELMLKLGDTADADLSKMALAELHAVNYDMIALHKDAVMLSNTCDILASMKEIERLANWFLKEWPEQIKEGSAVTNAIRILEQANKADSLFLPRHGAIIGLHYGSQGSTDGKVE